MDQIDEYEQGERVRTWLRNNGSSLLTGVVLGLGCLAGWQWWQGQQDAEAAKAAVEFHTFTKAVEAKEGDKAAAHLAALRQNNPDTVFPALAALRMAEFLHTQGKDEEALQALDSIGGEKLDANLAELAKLRAARLLTGMGRHEDALKRLDAIPEPSFAAVAAEIRGDAEMALGRRDAARAAYEVALASLDIAAPTRPMVEMKLTDAGGSPSAQPEI